MPFKAWQFYYRRSKKPKMQPKRNWFDYSKKMKMRGDIIDYTKKVCIVVI